MANMIWIKNLKPPIAVIGLGKSGSSALKLLKAVGFSKAELISFDEKNESADISDADDLVFRKPNTLVVSPGVPLSSPWIQTLLQQGCFLTSEISLAASLLTSEKLIGVTGSVGKSTVVSLLGSALQQEDPNHFLGGNLGTPFCEYALRLLSGGPVASWIVLELSSYQLENCHGLLLDFSAITFLSENHLERYNSVSDYYAVKLSITAITKNSCVFNSSSPDCVVFSKQSKCNFLLVSAAADLTKQDKEKIRLIGNHNQDNFALASKLTKLAGWTNLAFEKMYAFAGLPHRLENVGVFKGVLIINDSKATALDSVLVACNACLKEIGLQSKLVLLIGGKDKNLPWAQLLVLQADTRIRLVFFGACASVVKEILKSDGPVFSNLKEAINCSLVIAKSGDTVLLSPGGTSFDEFKNFEQRGEFFKKTVIEHFIR